MKVEKFDDKIGKKFAEKTKYNRQGIPLIGFEKTTELEETLDEELRRKFWKEKKEFIPERSHLSEVVQHYARIGAFLATINYQGKPVYEIGCGIAIPSLIYFLLTGNKTIAIDKDEESISSTRRLKDKLGAEGLELACGDGESFISQKDRNGITLLQNPAQEFDVVESKKFYHFCTDELIIGGYYHILPIIRDEILLHNYKSSFPLTQETVNSWIEKASPEKHFETFGYNRAMITAANPNLDMWVLHLQR